MNIETINEANRLVKELEHVKKMIAAIEAPYIKSIRAVNYVGENELTEIELFERKDELHDIILQYFLSRKEQLEFRLESL